ncbi:MAG: hypothetical protein AAGH57_06145 [Pseudomonadota bacterium]
MSKIEPIAPKLERRASEDTSPQLPPPKERNKGAKMTTLGVAGLMMEWKHGLKEIASPFSECVDLTDLLITIAALDGVVFLGVGVYIAILVASTASFVLGVKRLLKI